MTVEEMQVYLGKDDAPNQFEKFWTEQLALVDQMELEFNLYAKDFSLSFCECYDLEFKSLDNSLIYAKMILPKKDTPCPLIFKFHGYQGKSADWSDSFKYVAEGIGVVMMDVRGQSGKSVDHTRVSGNTVKGHIVRGMIEGPEHLFYKNVYLDIAILGKVITQLPQVDTEQLMSLGESQGGALALVAGAVIPKVKKIFSVYPFLSDFRRVLELNYTTEAYDELHRHFKFNDPFYRRAEEVFETLGYIDVKNFTKRISASVTMICGLLDDVCPPSTQFAIYNRLETQKEMLLLPEYGHEALNVECDDLIFNWATGKKIY